MKSFKDYAKTAPSTPDTHDTNPTHATSDTATETARDAGELAKKIANAYNGKRDSEMWKSILAEAEKSKRAGTLSDQEIENFYATFSPMLDNAKRKQLRAVVDRLKKI